MNVTPVPRRKTIRNIAGGMCSSFISRNNDVLGYWAMGKLYHLALRENTHQVSIDLLGQALSPPDQELSVLVGAYRAMLARKLHAAGLSVDGLASAVIEIAFDAPAPVGPLMYPHGRGDLFNVTVMITDDTGKIRSAAASGHCQPHGAGHETRSTRAGTR